ncbi:glycoside hydrolase family 25 protein [Paenibacillus caui]|uniref:glycoside hydrolase family 25 protein n=1 Tax=Paenibacillus caui TaxID=2873927 RepID=UPI001CA8BE09|nr:glycoside hydrolase family 25 protein [Paenibacillus caui]
MQTRNSGNAQGIDVSHHNGVIDWRRVAASGKSFAFIKASEGTTFKDSMFAANVQGAKEANLMVGAYHFVNAATAEKAREEAANFAAAMSLVGGAAALELPPVMDYENNPRGISKSQINSVASAFLAELEGLTSRKPLVYSGNDFSVNFDAGLGTYGLWVARYSTQPPWNVPAWKNWDFWQYSSTGSVAGINGQVDLNVFRGSVEELRDFVSRQTNGEDVEDLPTIQELQNIIQAQEARIAAMERKLNMSGKEPLPKWAESAVVAGKAVGAIKTSADKSIPELVSLQMLMNLGLLDPEIVRTIQSFKRQQS